MKLFYKLCILLVTNDGNRVPLLNREARRKRRMIPSLLSKDDLPLEPKLHCVDYGWCVFSECLASKITHEHESSSFTIIPAA